MEWESFSRKIDDRENKLARKGYNFSVLTITKVKIDHGYGSNNCAHSELHIQVIDITYFWTNIEVEKHMGEIILASIIIGGSNR